MKVVPQIIIFLVFLLIGWLAYDRHEAFRQLIDDIVDVAGLYEQPQPAVSSTPAVAEVVSHDAEVQAQPVPQPAMPPVVSVTVQPEASQPTEQASPTEVQPPAAVEEAPSPVTQPPEAQAESAVQDETPVDEGRQAETTVPTASEAGPAIPVERAPDEPTAPAASEPGRSVQQPTVPGTTSSTSKQPDVGDTVPAEGATSDPEPDTATPATDKVDDQQSAAAQAPSVSSEPAGSHAKKDHQAIMESRRQEALAGLSAARLDWHQGNHDAAVNTYWQLLREYPNHPDFAGELGNIYYAQGQTEMAVNAYSEAFLRLLKNRDTERAMQVLQIVYNIDQEQAALLREYLPPR